VSITTYPRSTAFAKTACHSPWRLFPGTAALNINAYSASQFSTGSPTSEACDIELRKKSTQVKTMARQTKQSSQSGSTTNGLNINASLPSLNFAPETQRLSI